jgi:polar amino acid transport system permease protein
MTLDFATVLERWPMFVDGAWMTVRLATGATLTGFVIGTFCAIARRSSRGWARHASTAYVDFGLASLGLKLPAVSVALAALTINVGAYATEIMRAGFDSIHKGQLEAAECLALSRRQVYWHVVLLPAMERVYPALTSQFVLLMLATSVCSQISAEELTAAANFVQSDTYRPFETYIVVGAGYVLLSLVMRAGFWGIGMLLFARRRRLGTAL